MKLDVEIKVTLNKKEIAYWLLLMGKTNETDLKKAGITDEQYRVLSNMYGYLSDGLKENGIDYHKVIEEM